MSRTKLGGNRIADKSIATKHLTDNFVIPERMVQLDHPTHVHDNKTVLDILRNTNPHLVAVLDLVDVYLTVLEVADARTAGQTLKTMIAGKADKELVVALSNEIINARGEYSNLSDAIRVVVTQAQNIISAHAGLRSHQELDLMFQEVESARGGYHTIGERFDNVGTGGGTGGTLNISVLTPWTFLFTLVDGQRIINLPNSYTIGANNIHVFDGPTLMYPGVNNDYVESSPTQIVLNYDLPVGTEIRVDGVSSGQLYQWVMYFVSTGGQNSITFLDTYRPGARELFIYEDGVLLYPGDDYTEIDSRTVKLTIPFVAKSNIAVFKRRY